MTLFLYPFFIFFFFNDTATTEIYTLSLHDALPIWERAAVPQGVVSGDSGAEKRRCFRSVEAFRNRGQRLHRRSEEHTSELQSPCNLVCRLLLEKKKKKIRIMNETHRSATCVCLCVF